MVIFFTERIGLDFTLSPQLAGYYAVISNTWIRLLKEQLIPRQ